MWLDRATFMGLVQGEAKSRGELAALQTRFASQDAMCDWFRIRLTQLEKERAQMILHYTGVAIASPVFAQEPEKSPIDQVLGEAASFDDVGDEVAKRLGIGHNPDGTVNYSKKA